MGENSDNTCQHDPVDIPGERWYEDGFYPQPGRCGLLLHRMVIRLRRLGRGTHRLCLID